jgi:hypothetical protein
LPKGAAVDPSYSLIVDDYAVQELNLINYVYQSPNNYYSVILFGNALLVNHKADKFSNVQREWLTVDSAPLLPSNAIRPYSIYPAMTFIAKRDIKAGEELFVTYGGDDYFDERHTTSGYGKAEDTFDPAMYQYTVEELVNKGSSLSTINVSLSLLPQAGKGAFSLSPHAQGETVAISPALAVPKHSFAEAGRECVLINYCVSAGDTDVALLLMGSAAMINHGGKTDSNVAFRWFDWKGRGVDEVFEGVRPDDLTGFQGSPVYLEFYATRPIAQGEELLLDYGTAWEGAWRGYLDMMAAWVSRQSAVAEGISFSLAPQFRQAIDAPAGFFPPALILDCVGADDCALPEKKRRPDVMNARLNSIGGRHRVDLETLALAEAGLFEASDPSYFHSDVLTADGEVEGTAAGTAAAEVTIIDTSTLPCGMYLAPVESSAEGKQATKQATGVFAGVPISKGTQVEGALTVLMKKELQMSTRLLREYTGKAGRQNYGMTLFGAGSQMRESVKPNIDRTIQSRQKEDIPVPNTQALRPYTIYENMVHFADDDIRPGSEMLLFAQDGHSKEKLKQAVKALSPSQRPAKYSVSKLKEVGHCLTHIYVHASELPLGGSGVFTESGHRSGDRVSISQALLLPKSLLLEDESSVLINYCYSANNTDVTILPLGQAALMNHGGKGKGNVAFRWFDWKTRDERAASTDIFAAFSAGEPGFDSSPVYLEFYATRPIAQGEELLLDYGTAWEGAWRGYLDMMAAWVAKNGNSGQSLMNAPQFRQPIGVSEGFFPPLFFKQKCFSSPLCSQKGMSRSSKYLNAKLSFHNATTLGVPARTLPAKKSSVSKPAKRAKVNHEPLADAKKIPESNAIVAPVAAKKDLSFGEVIYNVFAGIF